MSEELGEAGGAVTAALIAREVERAHSGAPAVGHAEDEPCANCGAVRQGPYCHVCGQAGHVHRSAGALVHDIAHGVFHFEGKIWHTLPLLAFKPGELTRRYVFGERAKFVSPMALFLFSVFLMFAVVSNLAGSVKLPSAADMQKIRRDAAQTAAATKAHIAILEADRKAAATPAARAAIDERLDAARNALKALALVGTGVSGKGGVRTSAMAADLKVDTGWRWLDESVDHAARNPELLLYKMKSYGYKYSWALIPISLPFLWLLFAWRRDVGFYDHAIFAIYSLSFMSLGVVLLTLLGKVGVPSAVIVLAAIGIAPVHMYKQLKGAYRLSRLAAGWRTAALLVIAAVTSGLYAALLFYLGSE